MLQGYKQNLPHKPPPGRYNLFVNWQDELYLQNHQGNSVLVGAIGSEPPGHSFVASITTHNIANLYGDVVNAQTIPLSSWSSLPPTAASVLFHIHGYSNALVNQYEGLKTDLGGGLWIPIVGWASDRTGQFACQAWFPVVNNNITVCFSPFSGSSLDAITMTAIAYT